MAEAPFYINKHCHTGQLRERAHQIAEPILQIVKIGNERLRKIVTSEYLGVNVAYIKNALDPLGFPRSLIKDWEEAEKDLPKLLGLVNAVIDPSQVDQKLGEFLIPLDPFVDPDHARYYLDSFSNSLRNICSPEGRWQMGNIQSARRTFAAGRIFKHGFFKGTWLARPKGEPIFDTEIENLVASDTRELPPPNRKPRFWWVETGKIEPSRLYPEESAHDLKDPRFPLARLERFLRLRKEVGSNFPELEKQAAKAVLGAYRTCVEQELTKDAQELIAKYTSK